jgi:hypothetical protein
MAAVVFVLAMVGARWDAHTGFTRLLCFGGPKWEDRLPVLRALPLARDTGSGYDGQFGAQLAVSPDPASPEVQGALDNPAYRSRRILLPWVAHLLGGGDPWATLRVFALENVLAWLLAAFLVWRWVDDLPGDHALATWLACMLSLGVLDSVRLSLTDLAGLLLILIAVGLVRSGRAWAAAAALALAGLAREASVLATPLFFPGKGTPASARLRPAAAAVVSVLPLAAWLAWIHHAVPGAEAGRGNFSWPAFGFARHCAVCIAHMGSGDLDSRYTFGLLGALSLGFQSLFLLCRPRWQDPLWRASLGFALLFWVLGDEVWHGYWAAARAVLPMTFAFNLAYRGERWSWARLGAANLPLVLHGVWRMLP